MGLVSLVECECITYNIMLHNRHCETPLSLAHRTCEKKNGRPKESSLRLWRILCAVMMMLWIKTTIVAKCSTKIWYLLWIRLQFITLAEKGVWCDELTSQQTKYPNSMKKMWWITEFVGVCDEWCYEIDNSSHLVTAVFYHTPNNNKK